VLARTVTDVALVLRTIAGPDPLDPLCADLPVSDYAAAVARSNERAPRIGLIRDYFETTADEASWSATEGAVEAFREGGAEVREVSLPDGFAELHRMHRVIMCAEAAAVHAEPFAQRAADYRPSIRSVIEEGLSLPAVDYARARTHQVRFRSEMQRAFGDADVLLTPATLTPAPRDLSTTGDPAFNSPWSYTGLPTCVLPTGTASNGLPVGVQLAGRAFGEADLLASSAWCEAQLGWDGMPELAKE
jgi:aspartyl-tRNA(Asn)/glutamyl-tRNA(Gln) amidotransferase subunit A